MGFLFLALLVGFHVLLVQSTVVCPQNTTCQLNAILPSAQFSNYKGSFMSLWPNSSKEFTPADLENELAVPFALYWAFTNSLIGPNAKAIETPTLIRLTMHVEAALFNALTAFLPKALPFYCIRGTLPFAARLSGPSNNTQARNTAFAFAFLRAIENAEPKMDSKPFSAILQFLGLDPQYRSMSNLSDPRDIANGKHK
jgi:hypothetical protein